MLLQITLWNKNLLPLHDIPSSVSSRAGLQWQLYDPGMLEQFCSQFEALHSSISNEITIKTIKQNV